MINSITEILHFRYRPSWFFKSDWVYPDTVSPKTITDYINSYPEVFKDFKLACIETRREPIFATSTTECDWVLCNPRLLTNSNFVEKFISSIDNKNEALVCVGEDTKLSESVDNLALLKPFFKKIYYEAKDIQCDWVQTIPMGMIMPYMLRCGGEAILDHINKPKNKTKLIAFAFGSKWRCLNNKPYRKSLTKFAQEHSFVDNMFCEPPDYYNRLCEYKFFLCPLGNGIQTPKICESIMCETVPVVIDHVAHRELRDIYNLPLLIVDKWEDITEPFLNEAYESKFKYIDWEKEKAKFLVENFGNFLK